MSGEVEFELIVEGENTARIAVVQSLDGHLTVCGPNDFEGGDYDNPMDAALGWHLEGGHLPAACYWVEAHLPAIPRIPELRAQAERGEFPKAFVDELNADDETQAKANAK